MKNILSKIEKFFTSISLISACFYRGKNLNIPKKNDYFGRFVLMIAGLIILAFILVLIFILILSIF